MTAHTQSERVAEAAQSFHLYNAELQDDPFPFLAALREHCPVARSDVGGGFWMLSRYEDVVYAHQHPEYFATQQFTVPEVEDPLGTILPAGVEGAEHKAYRQIMNRDFAPPAVAAREGDIRRLAADLLQAIAAKGSCEFVAEFAVPYPTIVFATMMGWPLDDLDQLVEWKNRVKREGLSPESATSGSSLDIRQKVGDFFSAMYDERLARGSDGDDVVGSLMRGTFQGRALTKNEFLRICFALFSAGLDTVTAQLAFALWYLGTHTNRRDELVTDPGLIPGAVEEFLRYHTTVNDCRRVIAEVEIGSVRMVPGDVVMLLRSAADRDPAEFEDPDELDFRREPNRHLAFGAGSHRCLGSHLARRELRIAFEEIHRWIPRYRVDEGAPVKRHFQYVMGVDELHLRVD